MPIEVDIMDIEDLRTCNKCGVCYNENYVKEKRLKTIANDGYNKFVTICPLCKHENSTDLSKLQ